MSHWQRTCPIPNANHIKVREPWIGIEKIQKKVSASKPICFLTVGNDFCLWLLFREPDLHIVWHPSVNSCQVAWEIPNRIIFCSLYCYSPLPSSCATQWVCFKRCLISISSALALDFGSQSWVWTKHKLRQQKWIFLETHRDFWVWEFCLFLRYQKLNHWDPPQPSQRLLKENRAMIFEMKTWVMKLVWTENTFRQILPHTLVLVTTSLDFGSPCLYHIL